MSHDHPIDSYFEGQYNNQKRVPQFPQWVAQWREQSALQKDIVDCQLDLVYGHGPREHYDFYACGNTNAPLLIYLHGGYWQSGNKSLYGFLTPGPIDAGFNVAIPNYDLCPTVALEDITPQLVRALVYIRSQAGILGFDADRIYLCGHSAGGHLTAMLMAQAVAKLYPHNSASYICAGIAISGLFELSDLIPTSINTALGLDEQRVTALSPLRMKPALACPLLACVGEEEGLEFHNQARNISQAWSPSGQYLEIPASHHFSILESLANPQGLLCRRLREMN